MPLETGAGFRAVDLIRIELGARQDGLRNPAVPNGAGLVPEMLELVAMDRRHQVVAEEHQGDLFGVFRVDREIIGVLGRDPRRAQGDRRTFGGFPAAHGLPRNVGGPATCVIAVQVPKQCAIAEIRKIAHSGTRKFILDKHADGLCLKLYHKSSAAACLPSGRIAGRSCRSEAVSSDSAGDSQIRTAA